MAINYPATLPVPQTSVITPFERRALSNADAPLEARAASRDRLQFERVTWTLTDAQSEIFRAWWKTDLTDGAAWFNAAWPVLEGIVERQHCFRTQPAYAFIPGGFWKVSAVLEIRGRGRPVAEGLPSVGGDAIAWFDPVDGAFGTLARANSGSAPSYGIGAITGLYAGLVGWTGQVLSWSLASWTSIDAHASPFIVDAADAWVQISWNNKTGWDPDFPFTYDASIGELIVTASIDGVPVATGERLIAISTPPTIDYPDIAWSPE